MPKKICSEDVVGKILKSKLGQKFIIISYNSAKNVDVQFEDATIVEARTLDAIFAGSIRNPNFPIKYNIGFIGQGKYKSGLDGKDTKIYQTWSGMLRRCYDYKFQEKFPTYKGCSVDESWHNFQNFAEWFEKNYKEGQQLDKDILVKGDKTYSPETCCFVPLEVNSLFVKCNSVRGSLPIGVFKDRNRYRASLRRDESNRSKYYLGTFKTIEEAFQAYKTAKEDYIKEVAEKYKKEITEITYQAMYNYKVEITD